MHIDLDTMMASFVIKYIFSIIQSLVKTYSIGIVIPLMRFFWSTSMCLYFNEGLTYLCFGKGYKQIHELNV